MIYGVGVEKQAEEGVKGFSRASGKTNWADRDAFIEAGAREEEEICGKSRAWYETFVPNGL